MSMTVGELVATFDIDSTGAEAGITRAEMQVAGLRRDVAGTLRQINGDAVRSSAEIGTSLGDGIRSSLDATLAELHPEITVDANSRPADDEARALVERIRALSASIDVNLPVDTLTSEITGIRAQLQSLADSHTDVTIQTNAAQALIWIDTVTTAVADLDRQRANVHVDTNAPAAVAALTAVRAAEDRVGSSDGPGRMASMLSGLGSSLGAVAGQAGQMAGMFGAAAGPVSGLVATLVDIVPAAAIAATALLSVAQAAAVIKIGTSGVGSALKAAFADTASGGGAAATATHKVADAEMALTAAQRSALQAQKSLTDARRQAARDLQDMNNQLIDGQLAQRQAVLDVQAAKDQLAQDAAAGSGAGPAKVAADQLAYDQAVQHLKEQGLAQQRLTSDTAAANKAGISGSQKVQSAQDQALNSTQALVRAQEALKDAQKSSGGGGGGVNALAAAMAKLAPNARAFVREIIALKPALEGLKLDVQQRLFAGLAGGLAGAAAVLLPIFRRELVNSAGALNAMGLGVLGAAKNLGTSGTLGTAMHAASTGLHNLAGIPGEVLTAFGQLAAAAGPQFDRLTAAAARGAASIGAKLGAAFSGGGLTTAINDAVSLIGELIDVGKNVGSIFMSIFKATSQSGGSFLSVLKTITGAMATAFASPAVQGALKALFGVFQALADTAAPLLMQALKVIAPVLSALGPPVQRLIAALGQGLGSIIQALGPVLLAAAGAVGSLVDALSPLFPVVGQIIAQLGPILTPIISFVGKLFAQLAPLVLALAKALMGMLGPILAQLPSIITPLLDILLTMSGDTIPLLTQLVIELAPSLAQIGTSFGTIMIALAPVLIQLGSLIGALLKALMPALPPIITLIGQLAALFSGQLAKVISTLVVPAIKFLCDLLSGNFKQAGADAMNMIHGLNNLLSSLPGLAVRALGDIGSALVNAGQALIGGFIKGISGKFNEVKSTLSDLTSLLPDWKGPATLDATILAPNGALIIKGFQDGIAKQVPALRRQLGGITGGLGGMAGTPNLSAGAAASRAAAGGGTAAAAPFIIQLRIGDKPLGELMVDPMRMAVASRGGNVQATLGRAA